MPIWRNATAVLNRVALRQSIYALPININHVRDAINEIAGGADIRFFFVDIDADKVRGYFMKGYLTSGPYASDSQLMGNVYVSINQSIEWRNFVAVKEMVHLLDSETYNTKDKADIGHLIEDMAAELDLDKVDGGTLADHAAVITAMEILLPFEVRKFHRQKYADQKIAPYELAQVAAIPERFIRSSMRDRWFEFAEKSRNDRQIKDIPPPQ
jgi:hypothetical protein